MVDLSLKMQAILGRQYMDTNCIGHSYSRFNRKNCKLCIQQRDIDSYPRNVWESICQEMIIYDFLYIFLSYGELWMATKLKKTLTSQ